MTDIATALALPVRKRNGDLTPLERLQRKSTIDPDGCWTWRGAVNSKGYGCIAVNGVIVLVHRLSQHLHNGPITDGLQVDHRCHNADRRECAGGLSCRHRRCWRPDHLEVVSGEENMRRRYEGNEVLPAPQPSGLNMAQLLEDWIAEQRRESA